MKNLHKKLGIALALIVGFVGNSIAGVIKHDEISDFSFLEVTQGPAFTGTIAPSRSNLSSLFDNNIWTMLSLGDGGTLDAIISPSTNTITSGTVVEMTLGSTHDESAKVFLGVDGADWLEIGEIFGNAVNGGTFVTMAPQQVASLGFIAGNDSVFSINVLSGAFNSIRIMDTSSALKGSETQDGFDIASFSVQSVPSPSMIGLFGLTLALIGFARRRA